MKKLKSPTIFLLWCSLILLPMPARAADLTLSAAQDAWFVTPSSANFAAVITNETGSGALVFATSPTLVTPALGTIASGVGTALTALDGSNVSTGTVADARIASTITRDGEAITGSVASGTVVASGFNGNLTTGDDTMQEVAQKFDDLSLGATDFDALTEATESDIVSTDVMAVSDGGTEKKITLANLRDFLQSLSWVFSSMTVTDLDTTNFEIGGVAVTPTAAELNYVDGVTSAIQTQLDAKAAATSGTLTTPTITSPVYTEAAIAASAIDWATATTFTKTLAANTTFTFSNLVTGKTINVALTNTASNYTVTWPTVSWSGGAAPTQTVGAKTDIYTFIRINGTIYGSVVQNF